LLIKGYLVTAWYSLYHTGYYHVCTSHLAHPQ